MRVAYPAIRRLTLGLLALTPVAACSVSPPAGPTVMASPGQGKTFEQFRYDDYRCRQYASGANNGVTPQQGAVSSGVGSAAAGTLLGAAVGALFGAATGSPGAGAAFGAGGGLLVGSAVGADNAQASAGSLQANYNRVYTQCMAASGQDVVLPRPVVVVPYSYGPPPPPAYGYGPGW